jgi:pimeloyl-ACP methyl ester carboxylesterase
MPSVEIPDLAEGNFERLSITGQLRVMERAARGEAVALIGSSMGGYLAALYAARHPEVDRLVLLAPAFGFAQRWQEWLGAEKAAAWRQTGRMEVFHYGEGRPSQVGYQLLEDALQYEGFPDFRQPALIFHGSHDDTVPAAWSQEFAADHPHVRLEVLDAGHDLVNVIEYIGAQTVAFLGLDY